MLLNKETQPKKITGCNLRNAQQFSWIKLSVALSVYM